MARTLYAGAQSSCIYSDGDGARQNGVDQLATRLGANQDTSLPFSGSNVPEAIELLDASGNVTQTLVLSTNQVGSVQLVADATTGEVVQRIEYDEFGRVLVDSAPGMQPFGFAGGIYDTETKLVRFGARDYASDVGRWIARDPVRLRAGANVFLYVNNDAINWKDPMGLYDVIVDNAEWHENRNQFNDCPDKKPPTDSCNEDGRTWEDDFWGSGKNGSECIDSEDGDLIDEGSFNFCPDAFSVCHVFTDFLPHFIFGGNYVNHATGGR